MTGWIRSHLSKVVPLGVLGLALLMPIRVHADTFASCASKRAYQRDAVREIVHAWFEGAAEPEAFIDLIQAEQGIASCSGAGARAPRLHATRLPRGLAPDQLGGVLLANELEWSGLVPSPEAALLGKYFRVAPAAVAAHRPHDERDAYDAHGGVAE